MILYNMQNIKKLAGIVLAIIVVIAVVVPVAIVCSKDGYCGKAAEVNDPSTFTNTTVTPTDITVTTAVPINNITSNRTSTTEPITTTTLSAPKITTTAASEITTTTKITTTARTELPTTTTTKNVDTACMNCTDPNASCQATTAAKGVRPSDDAVFEWATDEKVVWKGDFYNCICNDGFVANGATCGPKITPDAEHTHIPKTTTEATTETTTTTATTETTANVNPCDPDPCAEHANATCRVATDKDYIGNPSEEDVLDWAMEWSMVDSGEDYECFCNEGFVSDGEKCLRNNARHR